MSSVAPPNGPVKFDTIDKTALTAIVGSTLLACYSLKGATEAKNTPGMLVQTVIGGIALAYGWGFASAWAAKKPEITRQEYFSIAFSNVDQLQQNTIGKATSLLSSVLYPQKKTKREEVGSKEEDSNNSSVDKNSGVLSSNQVDSEYMFVPVEELDK